MSALAALARKIANKVMVAGKKNLFIFELRSSILGSPKQTGFVVQVANCIPPLPMRYCFRPGETCNFSPRGAGNRVTNT